MATLVERLRGKAARFYSVRDRIGANKDDVFRITRTWGQTVGDFTNGNPVDTRQKITPSPRIVNLEHRSFVTPHGQTVEADILIKNLLISQFPEREELDNPQKGGNIERFWQIGRFYYTTESIQRKQLTWDVVLKKTELKNFYF